MSLFSTLYGGGGSAPIGTVVASVGAITDPDWLPLTGGVYNRADYPDLDVSKLLTFDGNSVVTGPTLTSGSWKVFHVTGTTWYAHQYAGSATACARSTDNGATWSSGTLPQAPGAYWPVSYANGMFFQTRSDATSNNTYYTSTDGLAWTLRSTLPVINGYYQNYGGVLYIGGRYVMLPAYNHGAGGGLFSLWSVDGVAWTAVNISSGSGTASNSGQYYATTFGRVDVPPALGLQAYLSNVSAPGQYTSADGLTWRAIQRLTAASGQDSTLDTVASVGLTASGGLAGGMGAVCIGNHVRSWRKTNALGGFPMRGTNIALSGNVSEDHGVSAVRTLAGWFQQNTDLSSSRLLSVSSSGVVAWLDVNATKFRAVPPLQDAELPLMGQTLYMKAR